MGEVYRYQVTGPPHFGLTNLRTIQDWIVTRRLFAVPGVVAINSWGGTTKEFEVQADLEKLEAYSITVHQLITALGNANVNVGGREITIGQQSVDIRGVGLIDGGGNEDLTKGDRVADIENVVLTQVNAVPVQVKDAATVHIGYVPRLGIAGKDQGDDVALYDRTSLVAVTTHTVLHNLIFVCLLVFLIQWIFLGDLRSAIIAGVNIPFAPFFAIILLVIQDEDANLLPVRAIDFGIIVDSAVILVENIFRNFQSPPDERRRLLQHLA